MRRPTRVNAGLAWAGAGLALCYVVVAALTAQLASRPVLPLFDGFAPPTPYAWVNPPPERAGDNVPPKPVTRDIVLGPSGAPASNASTDDAQAIVGINAGSVPASPPDTSLKITITPGDAGALGPLPPGLRAVSNAYRIDLAYAPSGASVTRLGAPGTVALTAADAGDRMLYSADGQTWQEVSFRPYGSDHGVFTEFGATGWFVVASSAQGGSAGGSGGGDALRTFLLIVAGVVPVVGAFLVVRLPSPVPVEPVARTRRPPAKKGAKKAQKRRR